MSENIDLTCASKNYSTRNLSRFYLFVPVHSGEMVSECLLNICFRWNVASEPAVMVIKQIRTPWALSDTLACHS